MNPVALQLNLRLTFTPPCPRGHDHE